MKVSRVNEKKRERQKPASHCPQTGSVDSDNTRCTSPVPWRETSTPHSRTRPKHSAHAQKIFTTLTLHHRQQRQQYRPHAASLARRRPNCPELTPARQRDACPSGTALVASPAEDRVQAVFSGSQDTARPFANVPLHPVDPRC